ncbi:hypothetical protein F5Y04DRAFT_124341 [Hypomontagnella monticulosa]|nr:hypothetical protein F5Y04DRAFT_124341 [Hypomontagnella monticulosa]
MTTKIPTKILKWIQDIGEEAKSGNFYIYSQWLIVVTLITEFVQTTLMIVDTAGGEVPSVEESWFEPAVFLAPQTIPIVAIVDYFTVLAIIWFQFLNIDNSNRYENEELAFIVFWFVVDLAHWVPLSMGLPYEAQAVPLTMSFFCQVIAYVLCQNQRKTRLTGGTGIEYMALAVPRRRTRTWFRRLLGLGKGKGDISRDGYAP